MRKTLAILTIATLAFALAAMAEPVTHSERIIKLKLSDSGSMSTFDISDLEPGDNESFTLDDGRELVIYNNDGKIEITLDGEPLNLPTTIHKEVKIVTSGDGGEEDIIVRRIGGEGGAFAFVNGDEVSLESLGEDGNHFVFINEDGEVTTGEAGEMNWQALGLGEGDAKVRVHVSRPDPAAHLLASGVLDDLDEETRQRILDTLKEVGPHGTHGVHTIHGAKAHGAHKVIIMETETEEEEN